MERTVTIVVSDSDITGPAIPIAACDLNGDGSVTGADTGAIYKSIANGYDSACDLNGDGSVTGADTGVIYTFIASSPAFPEITIK